MQWDFWTLSPESAHQVTWLMGDRGIPKSWRHMNGYSSHSYSWLNADGELFWVEYHFKTVLLRRRAPRRARSELQADPGQHPQGRGAQLLQGWRDANPQRDRSGVRTELCRRAASRSRTRGRGALGRRRRDGPAPPTRCVKMTTTSASPAPWFAKCSMTKHGTAWPTTSLDSPQGRQRAGAVPGVRVLEERGPRSRQDNRGTYAPTPTATTPSDLPGGPVGELINDCLAERRQILR